MFTGLIEEVGKIEKILKIHGGLRFEVRCGSVLENLDIGDSIAMDGACQTVIAKTKNTFIVESVEETLRKTTFGKFTVGRNINLERALRSGDRIGGHIVQGHIDCVGKIVEISKEGLGRALWIEVPFENQKYLIPIGSIAINGISLTIAEVRSNRFKVAIIPHTWENTNLKNINLFDFVNIEFDYLTKIVVHYLESKALIKGSDKIKTILDEFYDQPL